MNYKSISIALLMFFFTLSAQAQNDYLREPNQNKPLLFADIPAQVAIKLTDFDALLSLRAGETVSMPLGQFNYTGTVSSLTLQNDGKLLTVIIKSTNRYGSFLTLSRIINDDLSVSYQARILSFQHGDCFILKKNNDLSYSFIKKKFYELVSE